MTTKRKIISLLNNHPHGLGVKAIAAILGEDCHNTRSYVSGIAFDGLIRRVGTETCDSCCCKYALYGITEEGKVFLTKKPRRYEARARKAVSGDLPREQVGLGA